MQIGEQDLPAFQPLALFGERLLDLHDHLGLGEHFRPGGHDLGAGADVFLVGRPGAEAGGRLDDHLMAVMDELGDRGRRHADAEFVVLDFLGNADEHGTASDLRPKALRMLSQEMRCRNTRSTRSYAPSGFGSSSSCLL